MSDCGMTFTDNEYKLYANQKNKAKFVSPDEEYEYSKNKFKNCSKCFLEKPLTEYQGNTSGCDGFDKNGYRLRRPECKCCTSKAGKGKNEAKKIAKKTNIPYEAPEGTLCGICGKLEKKNDKLVFDHCHKTNRHRGYLHNSCNRSLGVLGDNVDGLIKALNYLNSTEKKIIVQDSVTNEIKNVED